MSMRLFLKRIAKREKYTIGRLYIDGIYFCDALEDKDRGLLQSMELSTIQKKKVYGETAIPVGEYEITLDVVSPKFSKYKFYMDTCEGRLPRLLDVKGFEGVLLHCAEGYKGAELLQGCIGVGKNTIVGGLTDCKNTFRKLYKELSSAKERGEKIYICIN